MSNGICIDVGVNVMVFNATFYTISAISWPVKTTYLPLTNLIHIMMYQVHLVMSEIQTHNVSGDRH